MENAWREPKAAAFTVSGENPGTRLALPGCRLLRISTPVDPGSNGGPVLNDRAEVIGVATAGIPYGAAGLNFAVAPRPFMNRPGWVAADDPGNTFLAWGVVRHEEERRSFPPLAESVAAILRDGRLIEQIRTRTER